MRPDPTETEHDKDDDFHLVRTCYCGACGWSGDTGQLIARQKLECPNCAAPDIVYPIVPAPAAVQ